MHLKDQTSHSCGEESEWAASGQDLGDSHLALADDLNKGIMKLNVAGFSFSQGMAADAQRGNKHEHSHPHRIVLDFPFVRYSACKLLVLSGHSHLPVVTVLSLTRTEQQNL